MPRPDVSDERIPQILSAAATIFAEYGIDGASMAQIAQAADVSKATIYHYFESKDALVEALVRRLFDEDRTEIEQLIRSKESVAARIRTYIQGLSQLLERNRDLYPIFAESKVITSRRPNIQAILQAYYQGYVDDFQVIIEQGRVSGEIRPDTDSATAALALVSTIEGSILMAINLNEPIGTVMAVSVGVLMAGLLA